MAAEKEQISKDTKKITKAIQELEKEGKVFKNIEDLDSTDLSKGKKLYGLAESNLATLRTNLISDIRQSGATKYSSSTNSSASAFQKSTNDFLRFSKSKQGTERSFFGFLTASMTLFNNLSSLYSTYQDGKKEAMIQVIESELTLTPFNQL